MKKLLNIGLIALLAVAVLSIVLWLTMGDDVGANLMLWIAYIYLGIAVVAMVALTIANMGKGRNNSKLGLFVYGAVVVAAVVLYFVGSSTAVVGADGTVFDDAFTLKTTDMMLYLAYGALGATVVFLLIGEIRKAIK